MVLATGEWSTFTRSFLEFYHRAERGNMRQTVLAIVVASSVLVAGMVMSDDRDRGSRRRPFAQTPAQTQQLNNYQQPPASSIEVQPASALQTLTPATVNISISGFDSVAPHDEESTHQQSSADSSTLPDASASHQTDTAPAADEVSAAATAADQPVEAETAAAIEVGQEDSIQQQSVEDPLNSTESDSLS
jgi:hypothetical protein